MNIEKITPLLLNQADELSGHVDNCRSASDIVQTFNKYNMESGGSLHVLMQYNHNSRKAKAFIKISPDDDTVQNAIKGIFPDKFELSFVKELNNYRKPRHSCNLDCY